MADIAKITKTLREEGCPDDVMREVVQYCENHPSALLPDIGRFLNTIAARNGYSDYQTYKSHGFLPIKRDQRLVTKIYSPA